LFYKEILFFLVAVFPYYSSLFPLIHLLIPLYEALSSSFLLKEIKYKKLTHIIASSNIYDIRVRLIT
jgi:hypothetical protein